MLRLIPKVGPSIDVTGEAVVGRLETCEVAVPDGSVSRRHAIISLRGNRWFVKDQGSANGTRLDGRPVVEAEIKEGQELTFGSVPFQVRIELDEGMEATLMMATPSESGRRPTPSPSPISAPPRPKALVDPPVPPPAAPRKAFGDATDLPSAQPIFHPEHLTNAIQLPPSNREPENHHPDTRSTSGHQLIVGLGGGAVVLASLAIFFFLSGTKMAGELKDVQARLASLEAEGRQLETKGATLVEDTPSVLKICNSGQTALEFDWIGALYRKGDSNVGLFSTLYCPDRRLDALSPSSEMRFRIEDPQQPLCTWDGSNALLFAFHLKGQGVSGYRAFRPGDAKGACLEIGR